jgi:hypothetical protein
MEVLHQTEIHLLIDAPYVLQRYSPSLVCPEGDGQTIGNQRCNLILLGLVLEDRYFNTLVVFELSAS